MIIYIEDQKKFRNNLLELISEFSKAVGYVVNIQKSIVSKY